MTTPTSNFLARGLSACIYGYIAIAAAIVVEDCAGPWIKAGAEAVWNLAGVR